MTALVSRVRHFQGPDALNLATAAADGPFRRIRAPHHTVSSGGLLGRISRGTVGASGDPLLTIDLGELHLADGGTLILDDLCSWSVGKLQAIGRAFRSGETLMYDGSQHIRLRARFALIVTTNEGEPFDLISGRLRLLRGREGAR